MTNRATITIIDDNKSRGVYLHRNGDKGSVSAFVLEVQKRLANHSVLFDEHDTNDKREDRCILCYALLYGAIREWLGYPGRNKLRSVADVKMQAKGIRGMKAGHGCYKFTPKFECKGVVISEFSEEEERNYNLITAFFEKQHQALSIINGREPVWWMLDNQIESKIESDIATLEVLKVNMDARIESLKKGLAELA